MDEKTNEELLIEANDLIWKDNNNHYRNKENCKQAKELYEKLVNKNYTPAFLYLAALCKREGNYDKAEELYEKIFDINMDAASELGLIYENRHDYVKAKYFYEISIKFGSKSSCFRLEEMNNYLNNLIIKK